MIEYNLQGFTELELVWVSHRECLSRLVRGKDTKKRYKEVNKNNDHQTLC
jgi:hypothetical protein